MQGSIFIIAATAIIGTMAGTVPTVMGVEVVEQEGQTLVREVVRDLNTRACTNCVHVGGHCLIGEGNCYGSERALCTACGKRGSICVSKFGNCANP